MADLAGFELFANLGDLVIIATVLGVLGYGFYYGVAKQSSPLPIGAALVGVGLLLVALAYLVDFGLYLLDPSHAKVGLSGHWADSGWIWLTSRIAFLMIVVGFVMAMFAGRQLETDLDTSRSALEDLEIGRRNTDLRFQYLFNTTSNAMYSYRFDPPMPVKLPWREQVARSYDAVLRQCNRVFAQELGVSRPDKVLGQPWSRLESTQDAEAHEKLMRTFIENDYHVSNYELAFKTRTGVKRAVNVSMIGIVRDGLLERIWAVESNTIEFRQARDELRRRQRFEGVVARISSRLLTADQDDADEAVEASISEACDYIIADRALMGWLDDASSQIVSIPYVYSKVGEPMRGGITSAVFPRCWNRLFNNETVVIDDVSTLGSEYDIDRKSFEKLQVKSTIMLPLNVGGELVGSMSFNRVVEARDWSDDDVQDLRVLSELLGNFVLRLKSRRALNDALHGLQRATDRLEAENVYLREAVNVEHGFDEIIGQSQPMLRSLQLVEQVADTMTPVLILGATGTGKELIARAIHNHSDRRNRPLVKVNCAALPSNLIESELFGHEKGAFTGAESRKRGRFDLADGSTLFLDEIGEIPIELQAKLLRVLQEGEYERLGGTKTIKVDTRIVAATNRDLANAVREGEFRSDLFYRINTFPIELPALRDRDDDIELLTRHFVAQHSQRLGRHVDEISSEMMRQLRMYDWPGNVRELDGIVQRAIISSSGPVLDLAEPLVASELVAGEPRIISSTIPELKLVERDHIVAVLESVGWKISGANGAASVLGMPPSTLRSRMKKLGIERHN
ncbi:MAG: sigma 54-interacting transcriptional regulator [Pseudomonadota bacterium]